MLKKIILIILGIFLSLLILECGLRLAGFAISSYQQYKNNKALKNKSQYTIMCLGESTTAGQYPIQLQEILNKKYPNKFSVIDCGIGGTTLETILELLDGNINKYKPDITICMMGINNALVDYNTVFFYNNYIWQNLKIYKLFALIKKHIKTILSKNNNLFAEEYVTNNLELVDKLIHQQKDFIKAEQILIKLLKEEPNNELYFQKLLILRKYLLEYSDEYCYKQAVYAIDNNFKIAVEEYYKIMFDYYIKQNNIQEIKNTITKAIQNPNLDVGNSIGVFFIMIKPYCTEQQLDFFEQGIDILDKKYGVKAIDLLEKKDYQKAEEYFNKAEKLRLIYSNTEIYNLYKLIIKKLIDNNIKVICMQYPVRSVLPLQEQLKNEQYYDKLTFISNEKLFKEALIKEDYNKIFDDQFGGDFGHCTDLGNTLIAKNIVKTLEKLVD